MKTALIVVAGGLAGWMLGHKLSERGIATVKAATGSTLSDQGFAFVVSLVGAGAAAFFVTK